ncbi:MAG TPA: hypothetical protein VN363_02900 [Anaerolineales bacterium]|nr:hypothetical protein [Anaerolineales bacterium]
MPARILAPITHILPLTTIQRERVLPVPGKIIVRKGQKVSASDTLAEVDLNPEHMLLDLARGLGVSEDAVNETVQCRVGDLLAEGDIIAGPVGLARRVVRAPRRGRVELIGGGQALLALQTSPYELKAGLSGQVVELISDRGAVVEAVGSLIQGVWGNGLIDFGLMLVLAKSPDQILNASQLDVSMRGAVILGGHLEDAETLKTAADLPLRGLIIGSMDPELIPLAQQVPFPLIVMDGFGHRRMTPAAFRLLSTNERREVSINAEPWNRDTGARPEVVIPLPATGNPPVPRAALIFRVDQTVRVVKAPYAGMVGKINSLEPGLQVFPSGLRAKAAEVSLENGENVLLPIANLEVID